MKFKVLCIGVGLTLASCHKEELPIPAHSTSGNAQEVQVAMGEDYRHQLFYSLEQNEIVSSNEKEEWDLAFESSANGFHVLLNTSRGMAVHRSELAFADITSDAGLSWNWDKTNGDIDSTAFGDWLTDDFLYVIDLGYDHTGAHMGFKKVKMIGVDAVEYTIEFGDLTDLTSQTVTIQKNSAKKYTSFKFGLGEVNIFPDDEDWDLMFTQYTHLFYDPLEAYVVTGVLLNRFQTEVTRIDNMPFNDISYDDVTGLTYSTEIDYIGYDWKWYDYENAIYIIDPSKTFIVHTSAGYYYKLHFVDFYNELGIKGYPKMEVQQL